MTKEQLFEVIGEAEEVYVRDAAEGKKHKAAWVRWCALAACVALAVGTVLTQIQSEEPERIPEDGDPPAVEWEGRTYIVSAWPAAHPKLPEGCVYVGTVNEEVQGECDLYADPADPLRVYVHMRIYQSAGESRIGYLRYVDEHLRGKHFIRYNGQLYIRLVHARTYGEPPYDVDKTLKEQVERDYGTVTTDTLPEGFVSVGEPVFTGYDTLPTEELSSNERVTAVLANPDVPEVILTPYTWYSAGNGNGEMRHDDYMVFALYTGPLA